jgi:ankyrin repeat protein
VAATDNRLALARLLLDRGADPAAACEERGFTPLHDAVDCGHGDMATFLLSRHAPPDALDFVRC